MLKVAIIGGGLAGMGAADKLVHAGCDVTIFEARERLAGDSFRVEVPSRSGGSVPVEVSLSGFNRSACPRYTALLVELGVEGRRLTDDFSVRTRDGETIWSERRRGPGFPWLAEKRRFERQAREVAKSPFYDRITTGRFLDSRGYSESFRRFYLYPRAATCLAMPAGKLEAVPVRALVDAWTAHGLMDREPGPAVSAAGEIQRVCEAFYRRFVGAGGHLLCARRVIRVRRASDGVRLHALEPDGRPRRFEFDEVVFTLFPDRAVDLLDDATAAERVLASLLEVQRVRVVTHQDPRLMPRDRESWGAHNFVVREPGDRRRPMTYYLNRLWGLGPEVPDVFTTLNPDPEPEEERVLDERGLAHPKAGEAARQTARLAAQLQGRRRTWFCGSYLRAPFLDEQALTSGFDVADRILAGSGTAADRPAPAALSAAA